MNYIVKYFDENGKKIKKQINSADSAEIISSLKSKGCQIIEINKIEERRYEKSRRSKIKNKNLIDFLKQFSIMLSSGIDVQTTIEILESQEKDKDLKSAIFNIRNSLLEGKTLADSIRNTEKFPNLVADVIYAGEISSNLSQTSDILSEYYINNRKLKQNIKNSLYYPIILLIVTGIVLILMSIFTLPKFAEIFSFYEDAKLPKITRILINITEFFNTNYLKIIFTILIIVFCFTIFSRVQVFRKKFSKINLNFPVMGDYFLAIELQRFSAIASVLIKSGIDTIAVLETAANSLKNEYLKSEFLKVKNSIISGNTIYNSFSDIKILPDLFLNLINVGEKSSNLSKTMDVAYKYYSDQSEFLGKRFTAIFEPFAIIVISILIGFVVLAIAMPTFEMITLGGTI